MKIKIDTGEKVSADICTNTGTPHGCVLSSALFTLYTSVCRCITSDILRVKFSDDTSLTGMTIISESAFRSAVYDLVRWCDKNHLLLNVSQVKEMVIDFWTGAPKPNPLIIKGKEVEIVHVYQYKYLGTILDDKLDWSVNAESLLKKGNQRMYFMKKLKSFNVCPKLLQLFYRATVN